MGLLDIENKDTPITNEYLIQNKYISNGFGIYKKTVEICSENLNGMGGVSVKYRMTIFNYQYNICTKNLMIIIPEIESWWYIEDIRSNHGSQFYSILHDFSTFPNGAWIARDCMMFQHIINESDLELVINSLEQLALDCNIVIENH